MELTTPRRAVAMPWLLLLCLPSIGVLPALAQSTLGFISIDCGLPGETGYVADDGTTIPYTTDAGFIDTYAGSNHNVSSEYIVSSVARMWYTVRSFPSGAARNCYTLGSLMAGQKYLIRAQFYYGNYDGLNTPPTFDIYVGVDFWRTVDAEADPVAIVEAIVVVPRDFVQVCLVNTGRGVPFISGLDLRPLKNTLYPLANATQGLVLVHRINFGPNNGSNAIRYPDDPYDRLWDPYPDSTTAWDEIKTKMEVEIDNDKFQPPEAVMQTAFTPRNVSRNIDFTLDLRTTPDRSLGYADIMYFCEVEQLDSNARREFNVYQNGVLVYMEPYTPQQLVDGYLFARQAFQASQYSVSLNATANSTLPPIINAVELFSVVSTTTVGTDSRDASAITAIKEIYRLQKNWMGDPCVPTTLVWQGLKCSYADSEPPNISNVNVSSSGLHGAISPDFANLKDVQYLDLSNNNLVGSIPDTLSRLPSLVFLDLSHNKLNGSIPQGLLKKIQDGSLDLRYGNNPDLCSNGTSCLPAEGDKKLAIHIVVPVLVIAVLVIVAILCIWLKRRRRKQGSTKNFVEFTNGGDEDISLELENRQFTYMELVTVTNNFQRRLGRGAFGYVFHGSLENGTEVAVKLRSHSSNQGVKQFIAEAQVLTRIHHKNLVCMIGFCKDREHMALVYEYMSNGALQEHIVGGEDNNRRVLPWRQRLLIALESAQGLEYLHMGCSPPIIHRDVKTANILLNARLGAKIADFGLSKAYNYDDDSHVSTNTFAGTPGYLDPEYQRTMQPSTKSDVYSFGVVLLELVTGKPAMLHSPEPISVINWARQRLARGDIEGVVDARMRGDYDINAVWKTTEIALKCTEKSPLQRPSMTDLVMQLQECLELEESYTSGRDTEFYTGSDIGGMRANMGYNASTNQQRIDVSQSNATLR